MFLNVSKLIKNLKKTHNTSVGNRTKTEKTNQS